MWMRAGLLLLLAATAAVPQNDAPVAPTRMPDGALLVTFPCAASPHGTALTGSLSVRGGRVVNAEGVLLFGKDSVTDDGWSATVQRFPPGVTPPRAGLPALEDVPPKGVLYTYEGPSDAEVTMRAGSETLAVTPARLRVGEIRTLAGGAVQVQSVPPAASLTGDDAEDEFPSLAAGPDGRAWAAWQSWDGKADHIRMRAWDGKVWSAPIEVSERPGDFFRPVLGVDGDGRVWVVWAQNDDGNWELYARFLRDGRLSPTIRLTDHPGSDYNQVLATDDSGALWMAWQANRDGNWDILLARLEEGGLLQEQAVTRHPASDREPALCVLPGRRLVVAWDTYRHGSYDIYIREVAGGKLSRKEVPVACSPDYEAHATLAADPRGRVWIAWDNGGPNWGKHGRTHTALHAQRRLGIRCLQDGKLFAPAQDPMTLLPAAVRPFCELPRLSVDAGGRVWLFFRHLTNLNRLPPNGPTIRQARGIWNVYAMAATHAGWSAPLLLAGSSGRNDQRIVSCTARDGLWLAYAGDARLRDRAEVPLDHNVFAARLPVLEGDPPLLAAEPDPAPGKLPQEPTARRDSVWKVGGQTYHLLLGDTHRHTDISRCSMNYDGSLFDTYRYAQDVVRLDFLAISDHDQDILKHRYDRIERPRQEYAWWRSQKYADLCMLPGRFIAVYGYEHGGGFKDRGGHKNVLYIERGRPCVELNSPAELFAALPKGRSVAIPHQLADGSSATDWERWDGDFETVAEIFQARGNYEHREAPRLAKVIREGHYYRDAVGAGRKIGVIASSDHGLVHGAYAGVYVDEVTRRGVVEALRVRRTFGSTEDVRVELRIGDALLGAETECEGAPLLSARVAAPTPIARMEVIRDGRFIYTLEPGAKEHTLRYSDVSLEAGQSAYYYVRAVLADGELAWSSPIWVTRSR